MLFDTTGTTSVCQGAASLPALFSAYLASLPTATTRTSVVKTLQETAVQSSNYTSALGTQSMPTRCSNLSIVVLQSGHAQASPSSQKQTLQPNTCYTVIHVFTKFLVRKVFQLTRCTAVRAGPFIHYPSHFISDPSCVDHQSLAVQIAAQEP